MNRAKRPLNKSAVKKANNEFYTKHPKLKGKLLSGDDPKQSVLRKEWMTLYRKNGGKMEKRVVVDLNGWEFDVFDDSIPSNQIETCSYENYNEKVKAWREENKEKIEQALKNQREILEAKKKELERWNNNDKAKFQKWFNTTDEVERENKLIEINRMLELNKKTNINNFYPILESESEYTAYAYVYPNDSEHKIYLGEAFDKISITSIFGAQTTNSGAGVITHEMSHFSDIAGTKDIIYGHDKSENLPSLGKQVNADNFEYYIEDI